MSMVKINSKYNIFCQNIINNSIIKYGTLDKNHKVKIEKIKNKYNNLNKLYDDIFMQFKNIKEQKHILDYSLEQIHIISKVYHNNILIEKLQTHNISEYNSSTKFIILDILDSQS